MLSFTIGSWNTTRDLYSNKDTFSFVIEYKTGTIRTLMAGVPSEAGDADSSRAPGLTFGLQGSVTVHHGALLLLQQ